MIKKQKAAKLLNKKQKQKTKTKNKMKKYTKENETLVAVLSYLIIGIILYFADDIYSKSAYIKFHTKQALNAIIITIALSFILSIFDAITLNTIHPIITLISVIAFLGIIAAYITGIYYAANRKKKKLPVIGRFADIYLRF